MRLFAVDFGNLTPLSSTMKKSIFGAVPFAIPPILFALTTVVGAIRWYSPVPFWDMWDGTLQFFLDSKTKGLHAFFEQANEHRIVLSKIIFWLDFQLFGGQSYLLITVNVVLMFALWGALSHAARSLTAGNKHLASLISGFAAVLCFSWLQAENINWGYQSQFYMAYLLPLMAFLSMAQWVKMPSKIRWFTASAFLAVLSTVTMANGLLALPLLIIMLATSGESTRQRMFALISVTILTFALWKYHYIAMPHQSAPLKSMAAFLLMFFGGPIGYLFHWDLLTMLSGASVIMASLYLALQWIRGKSRDPSYVALVLFIIYIGAAGAAATISRAGLGIGAALAGRYETPVMLFYSTLLICFAHLYRENSSTPAVIKTLIVTVSVVLLASQAEALSSNGPEQSRHRMQAALALDLGVADNETIKSVYPQDTGEQIAQVHQIATNSMAKNVSVFALPSLRAAREALGKPVTVSGLSACHSNIDRVEAIPTDAAHFRLSGWAFDEAKEQVPETVFVVKNGVVVGAGLTGIARPDVQQTINKNAVRAGFEGYASSNTGLSVYCK